MNIQNIDSNNKIILNNHLIEYQEIISEKCLMIIFSQLEFKDCLTLRAVCRNWHQWTNKEILWQRFITESFLNPSAIQPTARWAYSLGYQKIFQQMVMNGVDVTIRGKDKKTLLDITYLKGDKKGCQLLLERDKEQKFLNDDFITPLIRKALLGTTHELEDFITKDPVVARNYRTHTGNSELHVLTQLNDIESCKLILKAGTSVDHRNEKGDTPLHIAARMGFDEICALLIQFNADVNVKNKKYYSPLKLAIKSGDLSTCKVLAESGANIQYNTLEDALIKGRLEIFQFLYPLSNDKSDINEYLLLAIRYGHFQLMKFLLSQGANINTLQDKRQTPLMAAANKLTLCRFLLDHGADVHIATGSGIDWEKGLTALHFAAYYGNSDVCSLLIDKRANPNIFSATNKKTPLDYAAQNGHTDTCRVLMERGAQFDTGKDRTPLYYAIDSGDIETCQFFIDRECDVNLGNETPLMHAAYNLRKEICSLLIRHGANFNGITSKTQTTPLHLVCQGGDPLHLICQNNATKQKARFDTIRLLIANGAEINQKDIYGNTPLHYAAKKRDVDLFILLYREGADPYLYNEEGISPLQYLLRFSDSRFLLTLLEECPDIHHKDSSGKTLLHISAIGNRIKAMKLLIKLGAKINVKDRNGNTPLHYSIKHISSFNKKQTYVTLIDSGSKINGQNEQGNTPLHFASLISYYNDEYKKVMSFLIKHGADVNKTNAFGSTPLHLLAWNGNGYNVQLLLQNQAQPNIQDSMGNTPLHIASFRGETTIVQSLVDAGAKVTTCNKHQMTPMHEAALNGIYFYRLEETSVSKNEMFDPLTIELHRYEDRGIRYGFYEPIIKLLYERGANVNAKDINGNTPLHLAVRALKPDTCKQILNCLPNKNAQNNQGQTALHVAEESYISYVKESGEILKMLLKSKVDVTITNASGRTAYEEANKRSEEIKESRNEYLFHSCYRKMNPTYNSKKSLRPVVAFEKWGLEHPSIFQDDLLWKFTETNLSNETMTFVETLKKQFNVNYIFPDGNCLFEAVAQITDNRFTHQSLRQSVVAYIEKHKDDFSPFITSDFSTYCNNMRKEGTWGGEHELTAIVKLLAEEKTFYRIHVFDKNYPCQLEGEKMTTSLVYKPDEEIINCKEIYLLRINENHYNLLRTQENYIQPL